MKLYAVAMSMAVASVLAGCSSLPMPNSTEFTESGHGYQYQTTASAMHYANASPLSLQGNENTRVLALFGMPDYQTMQPGKFSNYMFTTTDPVTVQSYITPALGDRAKPSRTTSTDLSAVSVNALSNTGMSAGAVGAAGAALMIAGADTTPDPRTNVGAAICYRPTAEQPSMNQAYVECFDQVVEDLRKALGPTATVADKGQHVSVYGEVEVPSVGKQPVSILVGRVYNHASAGFAPADKGGFAANLFAIQIVRFGDLPASKATVEDIGAALRKAKRETISYRLNASEDYRKRKDAEPVGVY
ncbi:hypothetical protein APB26_31770 [Pseudomonas aeruginosa]|uniref:hypothetical protein n=1 Tax=Pseudomonas aeruginosa TaxID=287 RepID=UPI00071BD45B|nr:hypothetical protein [Pseudomonas aeruginosa]KSQ21568.1 hypothetical protein APB26_31770 [Pseudomonas aeruginosa]RPV61236.1 hypothetical protein IPC838_18095 [Pseudomonas aeruginosa]